MNRTEFLEIPEIQKWQKACSNNPTQFGVYLNKLLIICNTTKLSVSELLDTDNHMFRMIEIYNDFKQKVAEGDIVHTRKTNDTPTNFTKYATSLKSFFGSQGFYIPPKFEFETRKGMPNYAEIELTDKETILLTASCMILSAVALLAYEEQSENIEAMWNESDSPLMPYFVFQIFFYLVYY